MKFLIAAQNLHITDSSILGSGVLDQQFLEDDISNKFPEASYIYGTYKSIAEELSHLQKEKKKNIFDGLILPVQHGDINIISHIVHQLTGPIQENIKEIPHYSYTDDMTPVQKALAKLKTAKSNNPLNCHRTWDYWDAIHETRYEMGRLLSREFGFKIFEAYLFLPGYRGWTYNNRPSDIRWTDIAQGMPYVQAAFQTWLDVTTFSSMKEKRR